MKDKWRRRAPGQPDEATLARRELRWGLGGALAVVTLLAAGTVLYVAPVGRAEYTAELTESGAIRPGDDVRIAGIPVGSVTSLVLRDDRVRMTFTVDDAVRLGDKTTLAVRMLTVAGGHYLAVSPAGTEPLGSTPIPADRVRLPYSLGQAFQDAARPIAQVDGDTVRKNFAALQQSLDRSPDGLRQLGTSIDAVVDILDRQNQDVSQALSIAGEYLTSINATSQLYGRLNAELSLVETLLLDKKSEIAVSIQLLDNVFSRIAALEPAYANTLKPMAAELARALPELRSLGDRFDGLIGSLRDTIARLGELSGPDGLAIDHSTAAVRTGGVCVPVPGRTC